MGLLQKAYETYDCMEHLAGVETEQKEPLAPIFHSITRAQVEITLDQDGAFTSARAVDKNEPKILIPVTEESAGRTSSPSPHPLCDQLEYVAPGNPEKHDPYVQNLMDWERSAYTHPKLRPILTYIQRGTILRDLERSALIERDAEGNCQDKNQLKWMVRWIVNGLGEEDSGRCWTDRKLIKAYIGYYTAKYGDAPPVLCMVSGAMEPAAGQHPKGIVSLYGNAKLISANDHQGYTYRGRFDSPDQVATVGRTASQKAHNALRWLAANQGVTAGGRTFLCWNPQGKELPQVTSSMRRPGGYGRRAANPTEYRQQLKDALAGWRKDLPAQAGVVIAAFDAATTGRLSITYYNELQASDFLQRLAGWDETCCWENGAFGLQSPPLLDLANLAFGTLRDGKVETDDRLLRQQMQRLVACRTDCAPFPLDMEKALAEKASNLLIYQGRNAEETRRLRGRLLFTACAAIRKYHIDHFKEEWDMALDKENTNRSYLFGRLLAVAESVERSTYRGKGEEERETNALRMQKAFALRPLSSWRILEEKLEPYYRQLTPSLSHYYRNLTAEITDKLSPSQGDLNQKLDDVYLLGYYHQRAYRSEKTDTEAEAGTEE